MHLLVSNVEKNYRLDHVLRTGAENQVRGVNYQSCDDVTVDALQTMDTVVVWRVQRRLLGDVVSWVRGAAKCPYGPSQNGTYVMTSDGNYYSATVADFAGRDAAVYRSMGPGRQLRTAQYNSRWLNGSL